MYNFHQKIISAPSSFRQFNCNDGLVTLFNCPLETKFQDIWSHHNYIVYVVEGRKIWHTTHGAYDLHTGSCVLVRKGAHIIEQFFDASFCLIVFFLPDEFIYDVLKSKSSPLLSRDRSFEPVITIDSNDSVVAFFLSMIPHFDKLSDPDKSLLELKFRELILMLADNPRNSELLSFFYSLLQQPQAVSLQRIMEENYCFNLKLEEFAQLCNRSLSAFKRDFQKHFKTTPGKWLHEKRLNHAKHLLMHSDKTVSEASFESGFESHSHFSRSFRQYFGIAPVEARQLIAV